MSEEKKEEVLEDILEDLEEQSEEKTLEHTEDRQDTEKKEPEKQQAGKQEPEKQEAGKKEPEKKEPEKQAADQKPETDGKKFFQKNKHEDKKVDALNQKVAELEDKARRQLAEFDNFRKRTDKEKEAMFETGAKSVIEKILPVVDNFERGLAAVSEDEKDSPFVDGMQKVYKQLTTELEAIGVKPIEAVGQPFDPNFHNAVMQTESEEYESGTVAQELQKGYTYRDTVVRHSMVAVVQ